MTLLSAERLYSGFMSVDRLSIQHPQFDAPLQREVVLRRPAACLLAYDPNTDQVLVVEEFRAGNVAAGLEEDAWTSMGPVAGIIEPGSTPVETARREAMEEAGLDTTHGLLYGPFSTLVSPGGYAEIIHHFVLFCDLSGMVDGTTHGLAAEHEHTTVRLISRPEALDSLTQSTPANGLLSTCLLHLERLRAA
jgi:ADP-ribose pyrophosphatase